MTQFRSMSEGSTVAPRVQSIFGGPPLFFWRGLLFLDTRWSIASMRTPHHLL
ncbi:hypothetical protein CROQUDRAFT_661630 [Cronartium quercuum f. sp. fusiforme G11]|uniref:Uncharacterized protein n=1 Tax=Cronartium quercuum f. sp. fusiforme G11 TaxID=708437 RepID=A0A9P6NGA8_9BASI|nr:hypothetical protein CROQUDRAFT_661630 [Cronartium quercuum f. sp. fusiforme G11]